MSNDCQFDDSSICAFIGDLHQELKKTNQILERLADKVEMAADEQRNRDFQLMDLIKPE